MLALANVFVKGKGLSGKLSFSLTGLFQPSVLDLCYMTDLDNQGCHGREKYLENEFFPGQGKVREFCNDQGNSERTWKVREKSGNLKINGYGRQTSENLFILFKREKEGLSQEIVYISLPIGGYS